MSEQTLQGRTIAFLVAAEGIEQVELTEPWKAVQEAGGTPKLLSPETGKVQAFDHLDKADTFDVDEAVADADLASYDALVLPGGVANPDALRTDEKAVASCGTSLPAGKPVAAICHAPWTLIEAGVLRRPHADLLAEPADRHPQRRRHLGRRGGRRRRQPAHQPQPRRPPGVQRPAGRAGGGRAVAVCRSCAGQPLCRATALPGTRARRAGRVSLTP